jgi:hypothetical protein
MAARVRVWVRADGRETASSEAGNKMWMDAAFGAEREAAFLHRPLHAGARTGRCPGATARGRSATCSAVPFTQPLHKIRILAGELSPASIGLLHKRLDGIAAEFSELMELDAGAPPRERRNVGLVLANLPWTFPEVAELRRR